jgi:molybdopterin biosynthesis enzyme MoaB
MKQIADKSRKQLEAKLANVFDQEITGLSTELRAILLDDMVTAFESRINVLNNAVDKTVCTA